MEAINLNGLTMNAVETDPNGVINADTFFDFEQSGNLVKAQYKGGNVLQGYLVGVNKNNRLEFRYCQYEASGDLNGGVSFCELKRSKENLIQIIEYFQWESRSEKGRNVIQELPTLLN